MTKQEIISGLQALGLKKGDKVLLHSSFLSLGYVEGGPESVIGAFESVLGKEGTLLVPVFGALGVLTDVVKKRPEAVISPCPVGTLAAIGADAVAICKNHWQADTAHGKDTPFTRLANMGGYVCLLGCDQDRNTSLHGIEALLKLPYLNDETATFITPEGNEVTKTWKYYPGPHRDFIGLDRYFREAGVMKISRIGNAQVRLIKSADLFNIGLELGSMDPAFVLCDNPECADCVKQRAAVFADRISKESFKLTVSSRLAGRYVPEIVENCQKCGVKFVELDYIQGRACAMMPVEKLSAAVNELRSEGISISALSAEIVPDDPQELISLLKSAEISSLILPLEGKACAEYAVENGIAVMFRNYRKSAANFAAEFAAFSGKCTVSACFNPAEFARAGENPFLYSYRVGRFIKCTGQLDLVDAVWDGTPKNLAGGNGEVKELMSIMRCRNFDGFFSLGGGAVYPGSMKNAVDELTWLLDNM